MYLVYLEKYIYVFNTEIKKGEVVTLETLDPDYLERRLSWYAVHNWRVGSIYKIEEISYPEWDTVWKSIEKSLKR